MTLHIVDISRYQVERRDPLDLEDAKNVGMGAVNIALDRGRSTDELPLWARAYADDAHGLGLGISTYRWLDNRMPGAESARVAYNRMRELGGPQGMAHVVDCEDTATEQHLRDYVAEMRQLLGRDLAIYSGRWWLQPRGWTIDDLSPYLWAAPSGGYLVEYPGDDSPHWTVDYGGWTTLAAMQYAVQPLPGTGNCSLSAIRDPAVWAALTGAPMASKPSLVTDAMWWFVEQCLALTTTSWSAEYGGTYGDKPGFHNSRDRLIQQGLTNDYSIRDPLNKQGPGWAGAGFDWTFPSAQRGDWSEIGVYSERIRVAWETGDPRAYILDEVLCQTPEDEQPEGFVFYPTRSFRVPDSTHEWHMHFSFIRKYLEDRAGFEALFSLVRGEPLADWQARNPSEEDMATLDNIDKANWAGGTSMGPPVPEEYQALRQPEAMPVGNGVYGNAQNDRLYYTQRLVESLRDDVAEMKARPTGELTITAELMQALGHQVLTNLQPLLAEVVEAKMREVLREGTEG